MKKKLIKILILIIIIISIPLLTNFIMNLRHGSASYFRITPSVGKRVGSNYSGEYDVEIKVHALRNAGKVNIFYCNGSNNLSVENFDDAGLNGEAYDTMEAGEIKYIHATANNSNPHTYLTGNFTLRETEYFLLHIHFDDINNVRHKVKEKIEVPPGPKGIEMIWINVILFSSIIALLISLWYLKKKRI